MGTPDFAVPSLEVVMARHQLAAVVTQPDRRKNRGQKLQYSPVKKQALKYNIPIYQPKRIDTDQFYQRLDELAPDIIVVVAFGQKIPADILRLPVHGCINVHASLLPKYRGAAPIQYAIINGEEITGVSTMYLSEGWDEGDIIHQLEEPISLTDTASTLHNRLAVKGAVLLEKTLTKIASGDAPRIPQNHDLATYAPKLEKKDGEIDWQLPAAVLFNHIRGMNPWPTAFTYFQSELIKVWEAEIADDAYHYPGKIKDITKDGISVGTGEGVLLIKQMQRQGARRMSAYDIANGLRLRIGQCLGAELDEN